MNFGELKKALGNRNEDEEEPPMWLAALITWLLVPFVFLLGIGFCMVDAYIVQRLWSMFFPDMQQFTYLQAFGAVFMLSLVVDTPQRNLGSMSEAVGYLISRIFLRPLAYIGGAWLILKVFA